MRGFWLGLFGMLAAFTAAFAAPAPKLPVEAFAALPFVASPELSPDGTHLAAKLSVGGRQMFGIFKIGDKAMPRLWSLGENDLNWFQWLTDDRLIIGVGALSQIYGEQVYVTRLVSVDRSASETKRLNWNTAGLSGDDVVHFATGGGTSLLVQQQDSIFTDQAGNFPAVLEMDAVTGRGRVVQRGVTNVRRWKADRAGVIRLGYGYNRDRDRTFLVYRSAAGERFVSSETKEGDVTPLMIEPGSDRIVVSSDHEGRAGIYEYDMRSREFTRTIHLDARFDVEGALRFPDRPGVAAIPVITDRPIVRWLDPAMAEVQALIDKAAAPRAAVITSWSRDRGRLLVRVADTHRPGDYFVFDREGDGVMRRLTTVNAAMRGVALAPVEAVSYAARDGLEIPAYLTLPAGRAPKGLPLIVMPHGGPWARDYLGYDHWAQFLANRGYAVLQPNFRGSTGYGKAFEDKGDGQLGAGDAGRSGRRRALAGGARHNRSRARMHHGRLLWRLRGGAGAGARSRSVSLRHRLRRRVRSTQDAAPRSPVPIRQAV